MIFDKFCGFVEKYGHHFKKLDLKEIAREAKLFYLPYIPHEITAQFNFKEMDWDLFHLPYPITAIEDKTSLIILIDQKENQLGISDFRYVIDFSTYKYGKTHEHYDYRYKDNIDFQSSNFLDIIIQEKLESLTIGELRHEKVHFDSGKYELYGGIYEAGLSKQKKHFTMAVTLNTPIDMNQNTPEVEMAKNTSRNASCAIEELGCIYTSNKFILKTSPTAPQKKGKKIPRSNSRPIFSILSPKEIRETMQIEHPQSDKKRNSPVPHERRRHFRRLRKESGYKEDKIIVVNATWIGTSEKTIGNKRYKVMLNI